jgi:tight adherence protein B
VTETAFYVLTFVATFLVSSGAAWAAWAWLSRAELRTVEASRPKPAQEAASRILRLDVLSTFAFYGALLSRFRYIKELKIELAEANLSWSVGRTVALMLLAGGIALNVMLRLNFVPVWGAWICAFGAAATPVLYIRKRRAERFQRIEEQLPEALDFLSRALIAGHSLPMSMELLSEEAGPPIAAEMRKIVDEYNLGMSMDDALHNFAFRVPSVDIQFFVSAVLTQSRTGGNLHELLENLSETIRERGSLKGQVRALTANGRLTALILSLLPVFLAGVMLFLNASYFQKFIEHPIGKALLFGALAGQVVAYFVIKKIADIKV